jgi:hypothetical protein
VGKGEIDADANVRETREGGTEVEVPIGTGEGGMEENAPWQTPEEERHRPGT